MSSFWRFVFEKLGTSLLTSTAYHPQTDGQSERTNQTVENALRDLLTSYPVSDWAEFLPFLQGSLNNSTNSTTGQAPNELAYGFKVRDSLKYCGLGDARECTESVWHHPNYNNLMSHYSEISVAPPPTFAAKPTQPSAATNTNGKHPQTGRIEARNAYDWSFLGVATLRRLR